MTKKLVEAIAGLRENDALQLVKETLDSGADPLGILDDSREAMGVIGKRFEAGEAFIPDLIFAGEIMREISDLAKPKLAKTTPQRRLGRAVIGTVQGDIHDIGKNIVAFMLDVNGFEVRDLGVDVPASQFVQAVKEFQPQVIGLSGFLALAFDAMKGTVEAIKVAGLRDRVKIMIGGGQISEEVRQYTGADAYGKDAMAGVSLAKKWVAA